MELVGPIGRLCERVHREKHTAQLREIIARIERLDRSLRAAVSQVASYRKRLYDMLYSSITVHSKYTRTVYIRND